jgi:hypothetical protein
VRSEIWSKYCICLNDELGDMWEERSDHLSLTVKIDNFLRIAYFWQVPALCIRGSVIG